MSFHHGVSKEELDRMIVMCPQCARIGVATSFLWKDDDVVRCPRCKVPAEKVDYGRRGKTDEEKT